MLKITFILLLSPLAAHAEDTYNFYFQKAPGPTVVNQGVAGPNSPKDVYVNPVPTVNQAGQPATPPATVAQAMAAEENASGAQSSLELSFGMGASTSGDNSSPPSFGYLNYSRGATVNPTQYVAGLQWNLSEHFALQGEVFYMAKRPKRVINDKEEAAKGTSLDYSGNLVITPFRLNAGPRMKLAFSGLLGGMSVPFYKTGYDGWGNSDNTALSFARAGSFTYGGRLSLEMWNTVALQATVRQITRFDSTHVVASIAFLL